MSHLLLVDLAGAKIRNVSRGVIGVALLQTLIMGFVLEAAGISGAGLLGFLILIFCINQVGRAPVIVPVIIWAWAAMSGSAALTLTLVLVPVMLLDNVLKPILMARGRTTPLLVILSGVVGGTISYGLVGLFVGPIVLAVLYELVVAWVQLGNRVIRPSPSNESCRAYACRWTGRPGNSNLHRPTGGGASRARNRVRASFREARQEQEESGEPSYAGPRQSSPRYFGRVEAIQALRTGAVPVTEGFHPLAPHHLPFFITALDGSDHLLTAVGIFLLLAVTGIGILYFKLHALPEHLAHRGQKVQFEIVAVLGLLALFTHNHLFWVAALLLALVPFPDFVTPLTSMAQSLGKMSGRQPARSPEEVPLDPMPAPIEEVPRQDAPVPEARKS